MEVASVDDGDEERMLRRRVNGETHSCPLGGEWVEEMESKISETHIGMNLLVENTKHLSKLETIATAIDEMKTGLLGAAIGKNHLPINVVLIVLGTFSGVIVALTGILVFLLTGSQSHLIGPLH